MTIDDELIDVGTRAFLAATDDLPDDAEAGMRAALAAMLAYRTTDECPTCGGTGTYRREVAGHFIPVDCPASCIDGRVPRDSPRVAIVERSTTAQGRSWLWLLAPDLPETEKP